MIHINDKIDCCGCNACGSICAKNAITFQTDEEGFWYPDVDMDKCVDCGMCEKVCPFIADLTPRIPLVTYAAINPNEYERNNSSSGGIFSLLASHTINAGGVVFGAAFDNEWNVTHLSVENIKELSKLRGSKYVQSMIGDRFRTVKKYLVQGKQVLFSGTACQIAGLNSYLLKKYDNLTTVDVVCHGVPSPKIWKQYVKLLQTHSTIKSISFRDKLSGWRGYDFTVSYNDGSIHRESHNKNLYMQGFLHDLFLRPSCYHCKIKCGRCGSDITLGDYWGIERVLPEVDDNKGVSVVMVNTEKGREIINGISSQQKETDYKQAVQGNANIEICAIENKWRAEFWRYYSYNEDLFKSLGHVLRKMQPSIFKRILRRIIRTVHP